VKSLPVKDDFVLLKIRFTDPRINDLLLIENGDEIFVTEDNYAEYVRLVEDFTCGGRLAAVRKRFLKGLFSVIEKGVWNCLTTGERLFLISDNGYAARCPQRRMFVEAVCEFDEHLRRQFLKFITGCERLPIGGLAALTPKISVARRISLNGQSADETLPTASICTHYFKLPSYSSKRIKLPLRRDLSGSTSLESVWIPCIARTFTLLADEISFPPSFYQITQPRT
jgi:hypothetical protein